ncbi:MAG: hypothetical protein DME65_12985 [Verrucomicrobia bacterium]|nr:MAG: hypothetical protein DME65_12985 [Verrucomicrobiota bacterium]
MNMKTPLPFWEAAFLFGVLVCRGAPRASSCAALLAVPRRRHRSLTSDKRWNCAPLAEVEAVP